MPSFVLFVLGTGILTPSDYRTEKGTTHGDGTTLYGRSRCASSSDNNRGMTTDYGVTCRNICTQPDEYNPVYDSKTGRRLYRFVTCIVLVFVIPDGVMRREILFGFCCPSIIINRCNI